MADIFGYKRKSRVKKISYAHLFCITNDSEKSLKFEGLTVAPGFNAWLIEEPSMREDYLISLQRFIESASKKGITVTASVNSLLMLNIPQVRRIWPHDSMLKSFKAKK